MANLTKPNSSEKAHRNVYTEFTMWTLINLQRSERVCVKCTQSEIGDQFHYIFNCPFFADQRRTYVPKYCHIHPNSKA